MVEKIRALTFDVYGTLIDPKGTTWEAISSIVERSHADADAEEFFGRVLDLVREGTQGPGFRSFAQLFRESLMTGYAEFGVPGTPEDADLIFQYGRRRQPYPEVPGALERLGRNLKLGLISNSDNKPLRENLQDAGMRMDFMVTSEMTRAYKPSPVLFEEALARLGMEAREVAHVGDSPHEDVVPAKALGMVAVWLNRDGSRYPNGFAQPDYTIRTLDELIGIFD